MESNSEKVWVKLEKKFWGLQKDIFLCFAYVSPRNDNNDTTDMFDDISLAI